LQAISLNNRDQLALFSGEKVFGAGRRGVDDDDEEEEEEEEEEFEVEALA